MKNSFPITARWTDPKIRKASLSPYARESETKTLSLLDDALIAGTGHKIDDQVLKQLQASAPRTSSSCCHNLQTRGEEYAADARKKLVERGRSRSQSDARNPGNPEEIHRRNSRQA